MKMRLPLAGALIGALMSSVAAHADFTDGTIKVGVLTDLSGPYEGNEGHGAVTAAQMAAEEFGGPIDGAKTQIISADPQNKPDVAPPSPANGSRPSMSTPSRAWSTPRWP